VVLPLLQAGIKNAVDRPRPSAELVEHRSTFASESFPSGHAMSGTVLFLLVVLALVALVPNRRLRLAGSAASGVILAVSMVGDLYLGMHWLSDVLGGLLWGGVLAAATVAIAEWAWPRKRTSPGA
jgi:membrane-associated phospholipid phosphatase